MAVFPKYYNNAAEEFWPVTLVQRGIQILKGTSINEFTPFLNNLPTLFYDAFFLVFSDLPTYPKIRCQLWMFHKHNLFGCLSQDRNELILIKVLKLKFKECGQFNRILGWHKFYRNYFF